jgi:sugar phosphate permease
VLALFAPALRRTTIVTTLMFACSYGAAFGAIQMIPQIVPGLPQVKEQVAGKPVPEQKKIEQSTAANVTKVQEVGGLVGRFLLAVLAARIVSRRKLLRVFQLPGLVIVPFVFVWAAFDDLQLLYFGAFLAGLVTVAQFSFWGNYLPRVYPTHLRGTGESFAANVGGRMIGTMAALVTTSMVPSMPGATVPIKLAYAVAIVGTAAYVIGFAASFWLPEPKGEKLPD